MLSSRLANAAPAWGRKLLLAVAGLLVLVALQRFLAPHSAASAPPATASTSESTRAGTSTAETKKHAHAARTGKRAHNSNDDDDDNENDSEEAPTPPALTDAGADAPPHQQEELPDESALGESVDTVAAHTDEEHAAADDAGHNDPDVARVARSRVICGPLCSPASIRASRDEKNDGIPTAETLSRLAVNVPVSCPKLFSTEAEAVFDKPAQGWPPPDAIPASLLDEYTLEGRSRVTKYYFIGRYRADTKADIQRGISSRRSGGGVERWTPAVFKEQFCLYGDGIRATMRRLARQLVEEEFHGVESAKSKRVLVMGSITPWVEMAFIEAGVGTTTTVEYGKLVSTRKDVETMIPAEFNAKFRAGTLPQFDGVASFSSLEHSGLGRYGDALNPWGDVVASTKTACVLKPGGFLVLGVPCGSDRIKWNAHRVYGVHRLPLMLNGLEIVRVIKDLPADKSGPHCIVVARKPLA